MACDSGITMSVAAMASPIGRMSVFSFAGDRQAHRQHQIFSRYELHVVGRDRDRNDVDLFRGKVDAANGVAGGVALTACLHQRDIGL